MKQRTFAWLLFLALAASGACRQSAEPHAASPTPAAPASEADWCDEHQVPESACTRCNPALIPDFQARGDWCEEHEFPESVCPICHPERRLHPTGEATPSDEAAPDDGPADGTVVRVRTRETARLAGLRFAAVVSRPASRDVSATARVVYDAARVAQLNPRMPGVIRAIRADVGSTVRAGAALATIESAGVGAEQSRLQSAQTRLEVADANLARAESLRPDRIITQSDALSARREREDARSEVRSAEAALRMVGASTNGSARYTMTAPIAGVVTERRGTIGRLVDSHDIVFEIVDTSAMWIDLDVPESELALVEVGQSVRVLFDGISGREFEGNLTYVAPTIDARTRTAVARMPVANADGALRANAFGRAFIRVSDPSAEVLVPRAAVQRARSVNLVFVRIAEDRFEARRVDVGAAVGDLVSVVGRLRAGEDVVTEGSFLLKTETLKDSIGAGCCEVD